MEVRAAGGTSSVVGSYSGSPAQMMQRECRQDGTAIGSASRGGMVCMVWEMWDCQNRVDAARHSESVRQLASESAICM